MKIIVLVALCLLVFSQTSNQAIQINLDLPPSERYSKVAELKMSSILGFITYLKNNYVKYYISFWFVQFINTRFPQWLKVKVGQQFYQQCSSIAYGVGVPISQIIVFNYMYQLGAANDFCTAITVSSENSTFLGRNLDYGFQEYLADNSVHFRYTSKGKTVFQTLGHAGLIGTHTALKKAVFQSQPQYAVTLNQRVQGGLHKTILQVLLSECQTSPYTIMKTLKHGKDINDVIQRLSQTNTCSPVYYTLITREGQSLVIEKNRGRGFHNIRVSAYLGGTKYIVQTNHDEQEDDPDSRSTIAQAKIQKIIENDKQIVSADLWKILQEKPNFNELTLMTGIINVATGEIQHKIWTQ